MRAASRAGGIAVLGTVLSFIVAASGSAASGALTNVLAAKAKAKSAGKPILIDFSSPG